MKLMRYMLAFLLVLLLVSAAAVGAKNAGSVPAQPPAVIVETLVGAIA